jgi:hypothetical protein
MGIVMFFAYSRRVTLRSRAAYREGAVEGGVVSLAPRRAQNVGEREGS